ncbi:hypothetical protein [Paenibacillus sp. sgz500958]|uniref:hypothetical protein n=1 Tax=Paenibacillus sp. sgz500958 TaxID=3242475 RepID=UPI0036D307AA
MLISVILSSGHVDYVQNATKNGYAGKITFHAIGQNTGGNQILQAYSHACMPVIELKTPLPRSYQPAEGESMYYFNYGSVYSNTFDKDLPADQHSAEITPRP